MESLTLKVVQCGSKKPYIRKDSEMVRTINLNEVALMVLNCMPSKACSEGPR